MVRYEVTAQRIVTYAYELVDEAAYTASELLERAGTTEERDHILVDHDAKRRSRLDLLDAAISRVIANYGQRRLKCPLEQGTAVKTYRAGLRIAADLEPAERTRRLRLTLVVEYQSHLHNLDARVFEFICQEVLRAIGCTGISVTKFSKDDGVDVLGKLPMGRALIAGTPLHRMVGDISFFIYLQAKRHRADVPSTGPEVQSVFGSWVWLQKAHADGTLSDELQRAMAIADYRSADPALIILATTSRFTPDALSKAKTLGILALDGEQIAQMLIEAGYGVAEDTHGSWIIDTSVLAALADETIEVAAEVVEPDGGADDHDEARGVVLVEVGAEVEEAESVADRSTETPGPDGTEPAD